MQQRNAIRPPTTVPVYRVLTAFPIAAFSLTALTDIAYWQTSNLLWLHFSEWLLLAGLVFGVLAALFLAVMGLAGKARISWPHALGGIAVLILAALNSFIHTADGWTAVMPYGLTISLVTVVVMLVTGWFAGWGHDHD